MALGVSEKKKIARCNPIVYKLENYTKQVGYMSNGAVAVGRAKSADAGESACTYAGIRAKTLLFLVLTIIGFGAYFMLHGIFKLAPNRFGALPQFILESSIHQIDITITELVIFIIAAVMTAIMPFLAVFFKSAIPVVGAVYTICQGYVIGFLTGLLKIKYRFIPVLALVISMAIVLTMLLVYMSGKVKVTDKFKSIMLSLFGTVFICSIVTGVLYVLPVTKEMVNSYFTFLNSPAVSLGISLVFFAVAVLFLLVDFQMVKECVEKGLPQKYEWMAAWGLAYSVIYIYLRLFGYLQRIFSHLEKSKS